MVGLCRVARAGYPDPTQFDPKHEYYAPKATRAAPIWTAVDLSLVRELPSPVTLQRIKDEARRGTVKGLDGFSLVTRRVPRVPHKVHTKSTQREYKENKKRIQREYEESTKRIQRLFNHLSVKHGL